MYYYIALKVSYLGLLNYNKNDISLTIDKKHLTSLLKNNIDHDKLSIFSKFLSTINIYNIDIKDNYNNILNTINKNDFVYIDPPYLDKNSYKLYFGNFNEQDHINLKLFVDKLTSNGYIFIKSNIDSMYIKKLYNKYNIKSITVNSKMNKKNIRKELLITNFDYIIL